MGVKGRLKTEFPSQGWKQFLVIRKQMLDRYEDAKTKADIHKVKVYHGKVAEAEFRKMLSGFLPPKYGITSGYIISQGQSGDVKAPHYDVIIYDKFNSPVLWIDDNPDQSNQGKSLAIPAEYVKGVIEVKSAFNKTSITEAIDHFEELEELLSGVDDLGDRYKLYLPNDFFCMVVFFELRKKDSRNSKSLDLIVEACTKVRGFKRAFILSGEGHEEEKSGYLKLYKSGEKMSSSVGKRDSLLGNVWSNSYKIGDNLFGLGLLDWSTENFARFAFDLLAILNGTHDAFISSFYAFGSPGFEDK
ncbi:DUF6602 domain-containing protein [Chloroflexota bacterium]